MNRNELLQHGSERGVRNDSIEVGYSWYQQILAYPIDVKLAEKAFERKRKSRLGMRSERARKLPR